MLDLVRRGILGVVGARAARLHGVVELAAFEAEEGSECCWDMFVVVGYLPVPKIG